MSPTNYKIPSKRILIFVMASVSAAYIMYWIAVKKTEFFLSYQNPFPATIFLIETSGLAKLSPRQACAVESAARHHPYSEIQVLMFTSEPFQDLFGLSHAVSNIRVRTTKPESIFRNTPLWNWYKKTEWQNTVLRIYDISDASRVLLIWKYGGVYLDLDTVALRSFYGNRNFLVRSFQGMICNGIFGFESHHPFLSKYLKSFPKNYKKGHWGSVGPHLFTEVFRSLCQHSVLEGNYPYCNLTLLPIKTAFPIHWKKWKNYFNKTKTKEMLTEIKNSYLIHVWNYLSNKQYLSLNSGSLYENIMKENCPAVYDQLVASTTLNASFRF